MLKQLQIQNIILVESAEIHFQQGFNVISGETGSGKSAVLEAIGLIAGNRADTGIIRKGAEKGFVEARFDTDSIQGISQILQNGGIDHIDGEELLIRREILSSGKSRAYINNQMAQVSLLKQIGCRLINQSGQHENQRLRSLESHREILDLFGGNVEEASAYAQSWQQELELRQRIDTLVHEERTRMREIEKLRAELEELQEAHLKESEEDELFQEYTLLSHVEDIILKVEEMTQALQGEGLGLIGKLSKYQHSIDSLAAMDVQLKDPAVSYRNALMELKEIAYTLQNYGSRLEHNPQRTAAINERLSLITSLKRKYGNTVSEVLVYQKQAQEKIALLENAEEQIERLKKELEAISESNNRLCADLTKKRIASSEILENLMNEQLCSLNMPKAQFYVKIMPQSRNSHGDDLVEFYLSPNVGESLIAIKECASGGELSRIMLALQTLLAGKEKIATLVFDEIDANIGGSTASAVGIKLKEIGKQHQLICVTHFAQVAKHADHHFEISKQEKEGRTLTLVTLLNASLKKKELARMQGG